MLPVKILFTERVSTLKKGFIFPGKFFNILYFYEIYIYRARERQLKHIMVVIKHLYFLKTSTIILYFPSSKLPYWIQSILPRIFYVTEKAWNYYPFTITGIMFYLYSILYQLIFYQV